MRLARRLMLALLLPTASFATDIVTTKGDLYKNAEVTAVEWDGLRITHSAGVAKIPVEELPQDLRTKYRYDLNAVATARKKQEDAQRVIAAAHQREAELEAASAEERRRNEVAAKRAAEEKRSRDEWIQETTTEIGQVLLYLLIVGLGLLFYFIPSIVGKHKTNAGAIFVLNLFLGWTFLGWVLALVWACTKDSAMDTLARNRLEHLDDDPIRRIK